MAPYTEPYDVADYLDSDEMIEAYLEEAVASGDPRIVTTSLANVARARGGVDQLSRESGIDRDVLDKALHAPGNFDLVTLMKVLAVFGLQVAFLKPKAEAIAA